LYVVGEPSGNPDEWSKYSARCIVVAASPEEACQMHDCYGGPATLIDLTKSSILCESHSIQGF
jgi:hypothetical protein